MELRELHKKIQEYILPEVPSISPQALSKKVVNLLDGEIQSSKELILLALKRKPTSLVCFLFPQISHTIEQVSLSLECDDHDFRDSYKNTIISVLQIENYSRLLNVELVDYGILEEGNFSHGGGLISDFGEGEIFLDIIAHNGFNSSITLKGYATGGSETFYTTDFWPTKARISVSGIKKTNNTPSWIELIADSALEAGHRGMAFFSMFAALENLIATIHDEFMFEYFLTKDTKKESIKEKIRLFASRNTTLRNKLNHITTTLLCRKNKFPEFYRVVKKWENLIKTRDMIAHGGQGDLNIEIEEAMYLVLSIIFTIALQKDVGSLGWSNFLKNIGT